MLVAIDLEDAQKLKRKLPFFRHFISNTFFSSIVTKLLCYQVKKVAREDVDIFNTRNYWQKAAPLINEPFIPRYRKWAEQFYISK